MHHPGLPWLFLFSIVSVKRLTEQNVSCEIAMFSLRYEKENDKAVMMIMIAKLHILRNVF